MDCLRTAKFTVIFQETFVYGSQTFNLYINPKGVTVGLDINKLIDIQGFKNIDVYGIKFVQRTSLTDFDYYGVSNPSAIVENQYDVTVVLNGQIEFIGTQTLPANTSQSNTTYILDNYVSEIYLDSPIISCKSIDFDFFNTTYGLTYTNPAAAAGHNFAIDLRADFYLYYRYQEI